MPDRPHCLAPTAPNADGDCILQRWIIVHEPGKVPEKKHPHPQTCEGAIDFLITLALCRSKGTRYTLVQLTWDQDLWVSEGAEELAICRIAAPRRFARRVRDVAERSAGWLRADPKRIDAVARGHFA